MIYFLYGIAGGEEKSQKVWQIQSDYLNGRCELSVPELLLYEAANALKFTSFLLTLAREIESIFITSDEILYNKIRDLSFVRIL